MALKLLYYGNPLLSQKAQPVKEINEEIKELICQMEQLLFELDGLGLAAPQIGYSLALFIIGPLEEIVEKPQGTFCDVYINPSLVSISEKIELDEEGCLSIPNIYGIVKRAAAITVQATNLQGKLFTKELKGLEARCFLHEYDHLNGILFIDRMEAKKRKLLEKKLLLIKKRYRN